jgi:uncharacterized membrane protein
MSPLKRVAKILLGVFFILAGIGHFIRPDVYVKIMPPYLPRPLGLVYLSGICEAGLGILVLIPRYTRLAAWGLIALLIAVFPANLHMAVHPELYPGIPPMALWLRLPLQGVFIAWAYAFARRVPGSKGFQKKGT